MFGSYYYGAFIAGTSIFGAEEPESFDPTSDGRLSPITLNSGELEEQLDTVKRQITVVDKKVDDTQTRVITMTE